MTTIRFLAPLVLCLAATAAYAHDYAAGDLAIGHPWSRATVTGAKVGGGYLSLTNRGAAADRLIAVSAPFAQKAEIHESREEDGVAMMRPVDDGVEIKPGETVSLAPGGKHLMFIGLKTPLTKGEKVKVELTFERAGKVEVEFAVEAPGSKPDPKMDHGKHGM